MQGITNMPFLCLFAAALLVSLVATPLAGKIAWKLGAVDYPSKRRINTQPTPRMGGIAIFLALFVGCLLEIVGAKALDWHITPGPYSVMDVRYSYLALAFVIIFMTGLIDDKFQLKPLVKLAGQILAASVAAAGGLIIGNIWNPFAGAELALGWAAYPITVIYLVAYVNIINLIDGLDGLASGITCIASLAMFFLARAAGRFDAAALSIMLVGSTLGFLRYNFHPASIFLGDSGSLTLGFALGTVSLLNVTRIAGLTTIIIPLVVAGIPIIDTASAIIRRKRAHVSVGQADKGHIHHRLIQSGFNQRETALLIYAWTTMLCLGAVIMTKVQLTPRIVIFGALLGSSGVFAGRLHLFEPVLRHHYDPKTGNDVLVTPDDPAFTVEEAKAEELHEEHIDEMKELLHRHNHRN